MKTSFTLNFGLFCLFLFLPFLLLSQSISEQIGGVKTHFVIKSDTVLLNQDTQILIEKGIKNYYSSSGNEYGYGYGYGYQGIHLEFISKEEIQQQELKKKGLFGKRSYYYLSLLDEAGNSYEEIFLATSNVQTVFSEQNHYAYSINLDEIPLILLDNLVEINIIKIKEK